MKRKIISIVLAAALLVTMGLATTLPVGAATEEDIEAAIDSGIEYLVAQQTLQILNLLIIYIEDSL